MCLQACSKKSVKNEFLEKLVEYSKPWMPNDPFQPDTSMGSMVDENQTSRVLDYIETGKSEGANIITGGEQVRIKSGGYYIAPTIFEGVKNNMKIEIIPCLQDNYSYLMIDETNNTACVIDPSEAEPIINFIEKL